MFESARRGTNIKSQGFDVAGLFADLRNDVVNDRLPQISYIVAPESFTEHPNWAPDYGAFYVSDVLSAPTANPKVWARTVLFYMFDEAGGMFDHIVQPTPPMNPGQGQSTVSSRQAPGAVAGRRGVRAAARRHSERHDFSGRRVLSAVTRHDAGAGDGRAPGPPAAVHLAGGCCGERPGLDHYGELRQRRQGGCVRPRPLADGSSAGGSTGPWSYTVEAGKSLFDTWTPGDDDGYALTVSGPNGFFRKFAGSLAAGAVDLTVVASYDASGIALRITNNTTANVPVDVTDTYTNEMRSKDLAPGDTVGLHVWLPPNHNWYDLIVTTSADADFVRQCAGHVENGEPSISDPKMAQVPPRRHIHGGGGGPEVHRDEGQSRAERSRGPGYRK